MSFLHGVVDLHHSEGVEAVGPELAERDEPVVVELRGGPSDLSCSDLAIL